MKWVIVSLGALFQALISTIAGVLHIEAIYHDVGRNFGASRRQAFWTARLPRAMPMVFTGLQLGLGLALIVIVIAENYGTELGIGYLIRGSWHFFEVAQMFVGLMVVALRGIGTLSQLSLAEAARAPR